jgi:hypothetical protein
MGEAKRRKERDPHYGSRHLPIDLREDKSTELFGNLPPGMTAEMYLDYVDNNWDLFGAFAYASYLEEGRGAVVVDWDLSLIEHLRLSLPEAAQPLYPNTAPCFYLGERSAITQALGINFFSPQTPSLLDRYDPELAIVLFLCWGSTPTTLGNVMGRTLSTPQNKSPAQLYIDNVGILGEHAFGWGPYIPSQFVRRFQVSVEHDGRVRESLRHAYDMGFSKYGKGTVFILPNEHKSGFQIIYVPIADLVTSLGADRDSRQFKQAVEIARQCDPSKHVAVIAIGEEMLTQPTFTYYPFLFRIGEGEHP